MKKRTLTKQNDIRKKQAQILYNKGFGEALDYNSFQAYLETIPDIPKSLKGYAARFPELVLVDARLDYKRVCGLLGVVDKSEIGGGRKVNPQDAVYWIRAQNGIKNRGRSARLACKSFADDEVGLTVIEGLALFAQNPDQFKDGGMELPASSYGPSLGRTIIICLRRWNKRACLITHFDYTRGCYGVASRGT